MVVELIFCRCMSNTITIVPGKPTGASPLSLFRLIHSTSVLIDRDASVESTIPIISLNPSDGKRIVIVAQIAAEVFGLTRNVSHHNIDQSPLQTDFDPPQTTRPT